MNLSCRGGVVGALAYIKEGDWRYGVRVDSELWTFHVPEYLQQGKLYFYRVRVHEAQFGGGGGREATVDKSTPCRRGEGGGSRDGGPGHH